LPPERGGIPEEDPTITGTISDPGLHPTEWEQKDMYPKHQKRTGIEPHIVITEDDDQASAALRLAME
jgi:hypothetical protein